MYVCVCVCVCVCSGFFFSLVSIRMDWSDTLLKKRMYQSVVIETGLGEILPHSI